MAKVYNRLAEINKTQSLTSSDNILVEQGNVVMRVPLPVVAETLGTEVEIEETVTQQVYKNKENIATLDTTMGTKANSTDLTAEVTRAKAAEKTNADNLTSLSLKTSELDGNQEQLIADIKAVPDYSVLPLLCGQPPILFGDGTPQESVVPTNWIQLADGGYNWNGEPSAIGQQYINTSATSSGRYIAVQDSNYNLTWKNF